MIARGDADAPDFDLREYLFRGLRHWKLVLLVVILSLGVGVVKFFITPKAYMAVAEIQIQRRSMSPIGSSGDTSWWLENFYNYEYYPTQERLLQSRGLAEMVVRDLRLAGTEAAIADGGTSIVPEGNSPAAQDEAHLARLASAVKGPLGVRRIRDTQLFQLTYVSGDPEEAARRVNAFARAFIRMGIESRTRSAGFASTFLTDQVEILKEEIAALEGERQQLDVTGDAVILDRTTEMAQKTASALNDDYLQARQERIDKEARYRELLNGRDEVLAETSNDPEIRRLRQTLTVQENEYNTKLGTYRPEWPEMQDLKGQIELTRDDLNAAIRAAANQVRERSRTELQTAQRKETTLQNDLRDFKARTVAFQDTALKAENYTSEIESRREMLDDLLRRQSQTSVTASLQISDDNSNVRIIETALVPGGPYRPSLRRNLIFGLMAGLGLSFGLVVLIEVLDRTVKNPEELERILGLPTLAVIPNLGTEGRSYGYSRRGAKAGYGYGYGASRGRRSGKDEKVEIELLPHLHPRLAIAEAYRSLRTALLLSSAETLHSISVTSAEAGEGKTATASNLAAVMAQLGHNVLLIDGDLRKPRQHKVFQVSNRLGLVNHLTGSAELEDVIFRTEVPNLYLCPSGPTPPNPSELLASARMREVIQAAEERFDFVIIDTPPVLAVTDAAVVGSLTDGVALCCHAGKLLREDARACLNRLQFAEVRILGTVLNRFVASQGGPSYSRKYRYYEAYGGEGEALPASPEARSGSSAA